MSNLKTYGDLKRSLDYIRTAKKDEKIGDAVISAVIGNIPGIGQAKTVYDLLKAGFKKPDTKKTDSWLDKLDVDDEVEAIVDDTVEDGFLRDLAKQFESEPDDKPLEPDFNMNQKMVDYLKDNYNQRTVTGIKEQKSVFDKFFTKFAYKFDKGYPDMNNDQDVLLLESLISEVIGERYSLEEANMVGGATNYNTPTGTWEKYIESPLSKHEDGKTIYTSIKSSPAWLKTSSNDIEKTDITINVNDEFTISSRSTKDLIKRGNSYYAPINYKGEEYYIPFWAILKPTGKNVEKFEPNLDSKNDPSIYHPFTPGHPQEANVALLFIEKTSPDWEFEYKGKPLKVTYLGDPNVRGTGYPKNDLQINTDPSPGGLDSSMRISLKADNATYVENWMTSTRAEQILGNTKLKKIVLGAYNALLNSTSIRSGKGLFKGILKSYQICMFIKDRQPPYGPEAPSILSEPLSKDEAYEAYTGDKKFKDTDGSANYFYKGKNPQTTTDFLQDLKPFKNNMSELGDLWVSLRGSNETGKGRSRVFYWEGKDDDPNGKWVINPLWADVAGITKSEDKEGNIKYS